MTSRSDLPAWAAWVLVPGIVLGAVALAMAGAVEAPREAMVRYLLLALIALASAPTHALLPDPAVPWLVRLNRAPGALLRRAALRWSGPVLGALLPLAVWRAEPLVVLEGTLVLGAVALYAFRDALLLGPTSQAWQEGRRGGWYRALVARDARFNLQVPHGLVPAMLASVRVYAVGMAFVAMVFVGGGLGGTMAGLGVAVALLLRQALLVRRLAGGFDRVFYHSSALFQELLYRPAQRLGARADLGYDAVYWVPARWRPHVWAGLVQLDRRLPLGRLVAIGALAFWGLLVAGVPDAVVAGYLVLTLGLRNAAIVRHARPDVAPPILHLMLQRPADWVATRCFMNLRWTLPTALVLGLPALLTAALGWGDVLFWLLVDVSLAFVTALLATHAAEFRHRRRLA